MEIYHRCNVPREISFHGETVGHERVEPGVFPERCFIKHYSFNIRYLFASRGVPGFVCLADQRRHKARDRMCVNLFSVMVRGEQTTKQDASMH